MTTIDGTAIPSVPKVNRAAATIPTLGDVMESIYRLSTEDQQFIYHQLGESFGEGEDDDPAFIDEINRRVENIENGTSPGIPNEYVFDPNRIRKS